MFIAVSDDNLTRTGIQVMRSLYPNEIAATFKDFGKLPREKNEGSLKRITCIGHGGIGTYGGYDADTFSDEIIRSLKNYAKQDESVKKTLTTIDLLGCMVGCDNGKDEAFALKVAKKVNLSLKKDGFQEIQVKAVTNLMLPDKPPFYSLYFGLTEFMNEDKPSFSVRGTPSEKDFNVWNKLKQELKSAWVELQKFSKKNNELEESHEILKEEFSSNKKELSVLLKKYEMQKMNLNEVDNLIIKLINNIEDLKSNKKLVSRKNELESDLENVHKLKKDYLIIQKSVKKITDEIKVNENSLEEAAQKMRVLQEKSQTCCPLITKTNSPRQLLDQNPGCNFTRHAFPLSEEQSHLLLSSSIISQRGSALFAPSTSKPIASTHTEGEEVRKTPAPGRHGGGQ